MIIRDPRRARQLMGFQEEPGSSMGAPSGADVPIVVPIPGVGNMTFLQALGFSVAVSLSVRYIVRWLDKRGL